MSPVLGIWASARPPVAATSFESIATVTVGSGAQSEIDFTSIPSDYTHLQIRGIARDSNSTTQQLRMRFNGDTGSNYTLHYLLGDGASASAGGSANTTHIQMVYCVALNSYTAFGGAVIDILDYKDANKYKTVRALAGYDRNGNDSYIALDSGVWRNTNAINAIKLYLTGANFAQYSSFALYGVKGA